MATASPSPKEPKPRSKVVVRRLPPGLPEDKFWEAVHAHLTPDAYDWACFAPGKASVKTVRLSRAYINFRDPNAVYEFQANFDGHAFVSDRGAQYRARVEYAPSQKVPGKGRKDRREGTLDKDPDFLDFCKLLEALPKGVPVTSADAGDKMAIAGSGPAAQGVVITPLMQALIDKHTPAPRAPRAGAATAPPGPRQPTRQPAAAPGKATAAVPTYTEAPPKIKAKAAASAATASSARAGGRGSARQAALAGADGAAKVPSGSTRREAGAGGKPRAGEADKKRQQREQGTGQGAGRKAGAGAGGKAGGGSRPAADGEAVKKVDAAGPAAEGGAQREEAVKALQQLQAQGARKVRQGFVVYQPRRVGRLEQEQQQQQEGAG